MIWIPVTERGGSNWHRPEICGEIEGRTLYSSGTLQANRNRYHLHWSFSGIGQLQSGNIGDVQQGSGVQIGSICAMLFPRCSG